MDKPSLEPCKGRTRRLKAAVALGVVALIPTMLSTTPAEGTVVTVAEGHNITVFHNIDFVAVVGYDDADLLTVRVVRNGTVIGTATGDAVGDAVEGFGLEVNHGPEGAPVPGDCWEGGTPNIRPGDHIEVLVNGTLSDEVIVDRIRFGPRGPRLDAGDVVVPFVAFRADGTAFRPGFIDSPEFRAVSNPQVRFEAGPGIVVERRPGALPGQLQVRYQAPFRPARNRPGWNQAQLRRALLGDGHAIGFGHVEVLPAEGMLVDGLTDTPGPAPGCEAA
ncbi:MAG TPA: hypothetical protein VFN12_03780 [Nocardioides sp.]|nr:hypothetical protein [Nocardioides sp.]